MSDEEEESVSEGFSASEDEWKPTKDARGGESSDDDDSDFDELQAAGAAGAPGSSGRSSAGASKKKDRKQPSGIKGSSVKKRKPSGQSLRSKLYNKYRPPPKTFGTSPSQQQNSPSASGSKNARTPNESGARNQHHDAADSSSESSVEDYLVNPADLDLQSTFFAGQPEKSKEKSPVPQFDCNAGITNLSDSGSGSEDNNDSSMEDKASNAFDFRGLLENANSLERTRDAIAKRNVTATPPKSQTATMDVNALLALGENQNYEEQEEPEGNKRRGVGAGGGVGSVEPPPLDGPSRLSKTKSTRIKRHTKTRPVSTVVANAGDTDDSDFEEVADAELESDEDGTPNVSGDLEIHVGLQTRPTKEQKTQHELEMALKRRLNRDIKDRQLLLHKVSLMCQIARSMRYNRLLGESDALMQAALKLLPSKNAYPTDRGVELKYLQSFVTWFKTAVKLLNPNLYSEQSVSSKKQVLEALLEQIKRKEARCKQDMIFIFIVLARGMGMHCRLIVNLQPMPLRPSASDLIPIKLKPDEKNKSQTVDSDEEEEEEDSEPKKKKTSKAKPQAEKSKEVAKKKESSKPGSSDKNRSASSTKKEVATNSGASTSKAPEKNVKKDTGKATSSTKQLKKDDAAEKEDVPKSKTVKKETISKLSLSSKLASKETIKSERSRISDSSFEEKPSTSKAASLMSLPETKAKPNLSLLKRVTTQKISEATEGKRAKVAPADPFSPVAGRTRRAQTKPKIEVEEIKGSLFSPVGSPVRPELVLPKAKRQNGNSRDAENTQPAMQKEIITRSRSKSPKVHISSAFLGAGIPGQGTDPVPTKSSKSPDAKVRVSPTFLKAAPTRHLRSRQQKATNLTIPQLDGAEDVPVPKKRPKLEKLQKSQDSDEVFEPSKPVKKAPVLPKSVQNLRKDRRVLSTDDEGGLKPKRKPDASDMWVEVWSEVEEQWICIDLFKGKLHCVDTIRKNATAGLAYVFAFQDDQSLKDVTARYCSSWSTTVRKARVEKAWLDETISPYLGRRTKRDIREDEQLRRIHADKPLPKSIAEFKDHPLYVLPRHLLKFQGLYPPDAPTLGFIRGEPVYSRDCVHLLHSREIWLKSARVVKLGEQPYKVVKARPKWDKLTRSVIKDQPLEIFGYWQTQDYEPPTAENGIVPRNAYGNVELFKACMLPKKTVHLRLPGLMRVCKKLNIDCANAVVGFDFHQGACHPMYDGFVVCEEFREVVTAAWEEDQQEQARKEQAKYEDRVYGNWKKLIKGLIIRERLKKKYNF
ncbi:uncharacterized protein Dana_GF13029 [Drosophila ananassae]|uniref:DNA repair protein complementing XP-C cells homolog n=1 Tax=Drosophila ananassae TaxID=7217 RepID=B3MEW0_DROAN|nr:DNA repair protein complementing XP-C cells homolog [Drosophila ananassae]EDV36581.1 uncharacterized protein Dana_GF13029 [Drosophila ananassae]